MTEAGLKLRRLLRGSDRNVYKSGLPPSRPQSREDSWPWCHMHKGAARPSSFALGNGRGSNGLEPGVKGPRVPFVPNARWQRAKAKRDAKQAR